MIVILNYCLLINIIIKKTKNSNIASLFLDKPAKIKFCYYLYTVKFLFGVNFAVKHTA